MPDVNKYQPSLGLNNSAFQVLTTADIARPSVLATTETAQTQRNDVFESTTTLKKTYKTLIALGVLTLAAASFKIIKPQLFDDCFINPVKKLFQKNPAKNVETPKTVLTPAPEKIIVPDAGPVVLKAVNIAESQAVLTIKDIIPHLDESTQALYTKYQDNPLFASYVETTYKDYQRCIPGADIPAEDAALILGQKAQMTLEESYGLLNQGAQRLLATEARLKSDFVGMLSVPPKEWVESDKIQGNMLADFCLYKMAKLKPEIEASIKSLRVKPEAIATVPFKSPIALVNPVQPPLEFVKPEQDLSASAKRPFKIMKEPTVGSPAPVECLTEEALAQLVKSAEINSFNEVAEIAEVTAAEIKALSKTDKLKILEQILADKESVEFLAEEATKFRFGAIVKNKYDMKIPLENTEQYLETLVARETAKLSPTKPSAVQASSTVATAPEAPVLDSSQTARINKTLNDIDELNT